ncbi:TRAP transporter small permease [Limibaculum sp. M0105]|uniref:TRAP transporter small permease protein n=1 Tax=Thermohalobaculum xanthum TaxID=2753746 RepID=A0A8J7SBE0_9RHOB|nr:TRAP transporter small permease [Thermohalobaculum xanthum]MBK0398882.1 TRAP transporter small permease [Thermohalobaculum xanthum]
MRAFSLIVTALAMLAALLFVLAGVMLTWEVVARYFFVKPTIWAAELSQLCLIWGTLIAMPWCLRERRHIRITAVTGVLPMAGRRIAEIFAMLAVALFSAIVFWKGWGIFWDSVERGRTSGTMLDLPAWVPEAAVPFGFAILLAQALIEAGRTLRGEIVAEGAHGE